MRCQIEELSADEVKGDYQVRASRILGTAPAVSKTAFHKANDNGKIKVGERTVSSSPFRVSEDAEKTRPPLESFAYKPRPRIIIKRPRPPIELEEEFRDFHEADNQQPSPSVEKERKSGSKKGSSKRRRRRYHAVDDSDDEDFDPMEDKRKRSSREVSATAKTRGLAPARSSFHCMDDESLARKLQQEEYGTAEPDLQILACSKAGSQHNPITATLQKCDRIAATLRQDLHASSSAGGVVNADRYAEVDASAAKIVTQADVCAACGIAEDDAQRVLKPYQLVGVNFMFLLHRKNVGGAILADEMGLGKTVQAVAFLALLKHLDGDSGPHLLVAPASLLENWQRELKKWCPSFSVVLYHGAERAVLNDKLHRASKGKGPTPFNVMLTCYSLFEKRSTQSKDDRKFLKRWKWSCVLMDEAHLLKDRSSLRTKHLRRIAHAAKQRLMLTGTPLQNDLQELWSLLEFIMPDLFNTDGVDLDQFLGTRNNTTGILMQDRDLISRIKGILGPFVLRRLKSDVMRQLVAKIQQVECVEMLDDQAVAYKEAVEEYRALAMAARAAKASKSAKVVSMSVVDVLPRKQVSSIFTQLRKLGNHPLLVRRIYTDDTVKRLAKKFHPLGVFGHECTAERVEEELNTYSDFSLHKLCVAYGGVPGGGGQGKLSDNHVLNSAKCQALVRLLPKLQREGHRPLIFSQWTNMLDILEWALDVMGFSHTRLDGSTQVTERQNIVDRYNNNSDIFAFLLSTRAGGQGLNLTGADTVIIHDVDFNPQMDRQAEDRCHRIGQSRPVTVYRLVTKGTVDESIFNIARQKLVLDAAVLESGGREALAAQHDGDARTMGDILSVLLSVPPARSL